MPSPAHDDPASRLEATVRELCGPGDRVAGSPRWAAARDRLARRLAELELEPYDGSGYALPYHAGDTELANLVGIASGARPGAAPLLVGAHFDTVPGSPGADDNAAAVAVTLEVARRLRHAPAERDVLIALFAAEEPPYFHSPAMGSTVFYGHQRTGPVHAAFVLDLVGHAVSVPGLGIPVPGLGGLLFVTGMESDPGLERVIRGLDVPDSVKLVTALNRYVGDMSDHHAFRLAEVPYLFLSCGRWEHYHRASDTPEKLDYRKMAGIAGVLEQMVRGAAKRDLDGPWEGYDTTPTDLATMNAAMGGYLRLLGGRPESRADIERIAARLMSFGL